MARPPHALAALLAFTAIVGFAWALVTPLFQAPDEHAHFGYVQSIAERFALPGDPKRLPLSTEQSLAGSLSNADQAAQQLPVRMEWSALAYQRWRRDSAALSHSARADGGGPNPASSNPPLYYLVEALPYRLAEGADFTTRVHVVRLASIPWLLLTVVGVWLLAGELFARDRLLQLAAAGTAALLPMVAFVSASVSPDGLLFGLWSFVLWLGVRILRHGLDTRSAALFFGAVGAACLVKATSYALLPAALFVLVVGIRRERPSGWRHPVRAVAAAAGGLALTLGVWLILARVTDRPAAAQVTQAAGAAGLNLRELASYVWQFYLPRLPFQQPFPIPGSDHLPLYDVWLVTGWAAFGWLEVRFPGWVYVVLTTGTVAVVAAALAGLWRDRRRIDPAIPLFFAIATLALLAGLHWTEYQMMVANRGPFNVGRYLLPLVGLAGLAVGQALRVLPARRQAVGAAGVLSGLFVLNVFSFGLVLERFYA